MQLHLDPVADAAVLPLEGGDQRLLRQLEAEGELVPACREDGGLAVICSGGGKADGQTGSFRRSTPEPLRFWLI